MALHANAPRCPDPRCAGHAADHRQRRQLCRRRPRQQHGAQRPHLPRAADRGRAGRAAVRPQLAPGPADRGRRRVAARGHAPAGRHRRRRQPREARGHRLGAAVHHRGGQHHQRRDGDGAVRGLLRAETADPSQAARRNPVGHAGGADLGPGRPGPRRGHRCQHHGRPAPGVAGQCALRLAVAPHHPLATRPSR